MQKPKKTRNDKIHSISGRGIMEKTSQNLLWDSSLSIKERIDYLLNEMTLEEKFSFLATRHPNLERLSIPAFLFGGEAAHGVEARNDATGDAVETTFFSQPIGMSASWDVELIEKVGEAVGTEARALYNCQPGGGLSRWAPTVDMERDPRWGRNEEGYGEEPLLNGKMASAYIRGLQGNDEKYLRMAATVKHFYANNVEEGRTWKSSSIDPRNKYEYYLEPFRRTIEEGHVEGMMTAYNEINGVPAILNHEVKELVKGKWGLRGHVVCDGGDMSQTVEHHHYYETHAETVAEGLKAGIDCFTDDAEMVETAVREAYERGLITEKDIDNALRNSFATKIRLGVFDDTKENPYAKLGKEHMNTKEAQKLCRKMAQESVVLLKNEKNFLPLSKEDDFVVIGAVGDAWYQDWYGGEPPCRVTLKQGIENLTGRQAAFENGLDRILLKTGTRYVGLSEENQVILVENRDKAVELEVHDWGFGNINLYVPSIEKFVSLREDGSLFADKKAAFGWFVKENFRLEQEEDGLHIYGWDKSEVKIADALTFSMECTRDGIACAKELAKSADKVILAVGCNPVINAKEEIDRADLILPPAQEKLVQEIFAVNPNVVLMLLTNYPYAINWEQEKLPAILQMATGSQEMGNAAADILFGSVSPAGKLPQTWYQSVKDLPEMDDYDIIKGKRTYRFFEKEVLYPFGYGKAYTTFAYEDLQVKQEGDSLSIGLTVKNSGTVKSDCVVQIYAARLSSSRIMHPKKQLIGFARLKDMDAAEKRQVTMQISSKELSIYDVINCRKLVEEGEYLIYAGNDSSDDSQCNCRIQIAGEKLGTRDLTQQTNADHYDDYENIVLKHAGGGQTCAAVLHSNQKAKLVYKDAAWSGREKQAELFLRSKAGGCLRILNSKSEKLGEWNGQQTTFETIVIPLQGSMDEEFVFELEGSIEISHFFVI